ncbi:MAG: DUF1415 domain-containing protein [Pseudohongiellaceae bacterium]|nr:DUF1415 domain-containing protein [Pseudohongiellaceae bacterium]
MKDPVSSVRLWLEEAVIGLNLCPFAKRELNAERIRFALSNDTDFELLLEHLAQELARIHEDESVETSLLIYSSGLKEFDDYLDFLDLAQAYLEDRGLLGVYQFASFHPQYMFAGTSHSDPANYTNRAPYPVLHILREASLERAIESYPDTQSIPERNIALMQEHSAEYWQSVFAKFD